MKIKCNLKDLKYTDLLEMNDIYTNKKILFKGSKIRINVIRLCVYLLLLFDFVIPLIIDIIKPSYDIYKYYTNLYYRVFTGMIVLFLILYFILIFFQLLLIRKKKESITEFTKNELMCTMGKSQKLSVLYDGVSGIVYGRRTICILLKNSRLCFVFPMAIRKEIEEAIKKYCKDVKKYTY